MPVMLLLSSAATTERHGTHVRKHPALLLAPSFALRYNSSTPFLGLQRNSTRRSGSRLQRGDFVQWIGLVIAIVAALFAEELALGGRPDIQVKLAVGWLLGFGAFCGLVLGCIGAREGWETPTRYASIMLLNMLLSPDNLVVFMMFLKHSKLPLRCHRRVISDGFIFAALLRLVTMLATGKLIEAFAPLQVVLAAAVFAKGLQMTAGMCSHPTESEGEPEAEEPEHHWAVRSLQRVLPVRWSADTDDLYLARDEASGRLHITRTSALMFAIGCSDLTFSSDNITAVLALTRDPFTLSVTMTLSILLLRPVYFLAAAFIDHLDALDAALGVILILIGGKLLLGQAGVEAQRLRAVLVLTVFRPHT
ncbi:hypothetical protein EMIHUDRAFT_107537 [Emiliania huxleyi CCMP1516]|uniref:Cation/H+ exchanger domain-containing protein n=2 Tax=Emiliania huxleyi TaxID=2903 RepID=A0A0D3I0T0_EMIH1|nr:hypothetical protein EMIHUDRAFT_107537 [Emiliania huxleyi CCMP1516]EOD04865.1 hypothetical protein EMIHUDRAFT_107537 [Emiliania huxleyi CCMP1516]|eukprot:XP_005757294.1 hypothetical protein EMIHUDRAFT_107537 [Emiliania huxleyi CCMP1516]